MINPDQPDDDFAKEPAFTGSVRPTARYDTSASPDALIAIIRNRSFVIKTSVIIDTITMPASLVQPQPPQRT